MNDKTTPSLVEDDFSREEELFRQAFDRHALDLDGEPVTFEHPVAATRRRNWWIAALALISVASVGTWYATQDDEVTNQVPTLGTPSATSGTPSQAPSNSATASTTPTASTTSTAPSTSASASSSSSASSSASSATSTAPTATSTAAATWPSAASVAALPAAPSGWRWANGGNVAVQVPTAWTTDDDNCVSYVDGPPDDGPFVLQPGGNLAARCAAGETRPSVLHLSWGLPQEGSASNPSAPAGSLSRTVNGVLVAVGRNDGTAMTEADRTLANQVLTSASTFTSDQYNCPVTSPMTPREQPRPAAWQVTSTGMQTVSVCSYDAFGQLSGSGQMTVAESDRATTLLDAIAAAPAGTTAGGADCASTMAPRTLIRVTGTGGTRDLYLYNSGECSNYVDDGTTKRQVTANWCQGLYTIGPFDTSLFSAPAKGQCVVS